MTKEEVIEKLCELVMNVRNEAFPGDVADCICGYNTLVGPSPKVSDKVIEFIQEAVKKELLALED